MSYICLHCGTPVRDGFRFCSVCGTPISEPRAQTKASDGTLPYSRLTGIEGRAIRVLTGCKAGQFIGVYPAVTIGTQGAACVLEDDPTISPMHARIYCEGESLYVEELSSMNGVFCRIRDKVMLQKNDIIQAGNSLFLFETFNTADFVDASGTEFYASPMHGERFRLVEILNGGLRGRAATAPESGITVGRSEAAFMCPNDICMSAMHFSVRWLQRGAVLIDHESYNGTFLQIHKKTELQKDDQFIIGRTLFSVV